MDDSGATATEETTTEKLRTITLDDSLAAAPNRDVEHEREVAIFDLVERNSFSVTGKPSGPYALHLSIAEKRLKFDIRDHNDEVCSVIGLSLSPFRRIVKDYYMICDSYFQAIKTSAPSQIETLDMARRGLHNDGSVLLQERLKGKIETDFETARRLFTLICVLHWRG